MRFLFVDRIVQSSSDGWVRGLKQITSDEACLTTDEQGRACFIPSLIGETLGQLAAWRVMKDNDFSLRPVAGVVSSARLYRPAYVGETLLLESFIEAVDDRAVQYHSLASVRNEPVFSIEGALGPLLPMGDFIDSGVVKQQFLAINRLGDWSSVRTDVLLQAPYSGIQPSTTLPPLSFDRILASEPGVSLLAEKRVGAEAPYFPDHFPNKPVLPMTVLLECKMNLAREFLAQAGLSNQYQVSELRKIKMNEFVQPGDVVICQVKVKQQTDDVLILSYRSEVEGRRVCVVDVVLISKGSMT